MPSKKQIKQWQDEYHARVADEASGKSLYDEFFVQKIMTQDGYLSFAVYGKITDRDTSNFLMIVLIAKNDAKHNGLPIIEASKSGYADTLKEVADFFEATCKIYNPKVYPQIELARLDNDYLAFTKRKYSN